MESFELENAWVSYETQCHVSCLDKKDEGNSDWISNQQILCFVIEIV